MRHFSFASLLGVLVAAMSPESAHACSPVLPLKTRTQNAATAEHIYLAKLVTLKRVPLQGDPEMQYSALEQATFQVLQTVKGVPPHNGTIRTRTEYTGSNCTLSLILPYMVVRDGKAVPPTLSGTWLLFVSGSQPYSLGEFSGTSPMEAVSEAELKSIRAVAGKVSGVK